MGAGGDRGAADNLHTHTAGEDEADRKPVIALLILNWRKWLWWNPKTGEAMVRGFKWKLREEILEYLETGRVVFSLRDVKTWEEPNRTLGMAILRDEGLLEREIALELL